jgi:predicted small secreted protein
MPNIVQVLISKLNGSQLERQTAIDLSAENVTFDPSTSDLESTDAQAAIAEAANSAPPIENLTEVETYFEAAELSTTSDGWVTALQQETLAKAGGDYLIIHSSAIKQSQTNKIMEYKIEYRINATGSWIELVTIPYEGRGNSYTLQTGLNEVSLSTDDTVEVRLQYGQTMAGGTAYIKNKGFLIYKIRN